MTDDIFLAALSDHVGSSIEIISQKQSGKI
jgi:hypothetical protein